MFSEIVLRASPFFWSLTETSCNTNSVECYFRQLIYEIAVFDLNRGIYFYTVENRAGVVVFWENDGRVKI